MTFRETILKESKKIGIELSPKVLDIFEVYKNMLQDWDKTRFNLTSITKDSEIAIRHFIDSLYLAKAIPIKGKENIIDIGSGAGFPGLPIKIAFPSVRLTLVDSQKKKIFFIGVLLRRLGIYDVALLNTRGEKLGKEEKFREKFDIVLMRGVSKMPIISEIAIPLLKIDGRAVFWKGREEIEKISDSISLIEKMGGKIESIKEYKLLNVPHKSYLVVVRKERETPKKYPRTYSSMLRALKRNAKNK